MPPVRSTTTAPRSAGSTGPGRRRPQDQYGLPLTTGPEAAEAYRDGLDRLLTLRDGAGEAIQRALALDPGFALAHAVLATVLAEQGADRPTLQVHLHAARRHSPGATEREASFVTTAVLWCADGLSGDDALVRHVGRWPRDAFAVSLVAPSIATAGVSSGVVDVWPLLDEISRHYRGDWWLAGLRAFARTEQGRWAEADDLADAALALRPSAGHGAHARAHVLYETGRHDECVRWIDAWQAGEGSGQRFACHFSWHAALCELALGRPAAVRRRFDGCLRNLQGSRALVDAGSLLARCAVHGHPLGRARAVAVAEAAGETLSTPASPFLAWHAVVLAGVCDDGEQIDALEDLARRRVTGRAVDSDAWCMVVSICRAVRAAGQGDQALAAALLSSLGDTVGLGGSAAQRELLDDLALHALAAAGEHDAAAAVATRRLRRRPSAFDRALRRNPRAPAER